MALKTSFFSFFQTSVCRISLFSLISLMPLRWLSKHLFMPAVYAHTCLSLPTVLSILSASEMLAEASELFSECWLVPFASQMLIQITVCLQYIWSWTPIVIVQVTHLFTVFPCLLLFLLKSVILIWSAVSFPYEHLVPEIVQALIMVSVCYLQIWSRICDFMTSSLCIIWVGFHFYSFLICFQLANTRYFFCFVLSVKLLNLAWNTLVCVNCA